MSVELSLCEKDRHHLEKFIGCLDANISIRNKIVKLNGNIYNTCRINVCCTEMCKDLIKLGCTPQKTYDIKFPSMDIVPKQYLRDFVRGFFDGDGCISISKMNGKPHIVLSITGMSDMLRSISDFLISEKVLRVNPKISKDKRREYTYNVYYHGYDSCKEILDYLYKDSNIYLDRKFELYTEFYKNYNDEISKRGVYFDKNSKKYVSTICINGTKITLGKYSDFNDALMARVNAEIEKMNLSLPA